MKKREHLLLTCNRLTLALFISGGLNILLLAFGFYWFLHETPLPPIQPPLASLSLEQLMIKPTFQQPIHNQLLDNDLVPHQPQFTEPPILEKKPPLKAKAAKILPKAELPKSSSKEEEAIYIVREGDSLWKIAHRFGISIKELQSYNGLSSDLLHPGKQLFIP